MVDDSDSNTRKVVKIKIITAILEILAKAKNINVKYNERVVVDDDLTIALLKAKKEN